jgi:hypothetical protein
MIAGLPATYRAVPRKAQRAGRAGAPPPRRRRRPRRRENPGRRAPFVSVMTEHRFPPTAAAAAGAAAAESTPDQTTAADGDAIELRIRREEAEALLLAVDALTPLLERLRREIAPPAPEPEANGAASTPDFDDALRRATSLARESLREARAAIGSRRPTAEQRRAWQEAARRYVAARTRAGSRAR